MKNAMDIFRPKFFSPTREWNSLQREMNRLFDMFPRAEENWEVSSGRFMPSCDVTETEKQFQIAMDLPGIKKEDVKVEVADGVLSISGERKEVKEEKTATRFLSERTQGSFLRSFALPAEVDVERVEAAFENGELRIAVPKTAAAKKHEVKIGSSLSKVHSHTETEKDKTEKLKAV